MRVVKAFTQEEPEKRRFAKLNRDYIRMNMDLALVQSALFPSLRLLMGVSVVILLWMGGTMVARGTLSLGKLVEFSLVQMMIFWPLIALGWTISLMQRGAASMDRIMEIMDRQPEILDTAACCKDGAEPPCGMCVTRGEVEYRNPVVPATRRICRWFSRTSMCASRLAAVSGWWGPRGSGKSTLASLIAHLLPASSAGSCWWTATTSTTFPSNGLREQVGFVFQEDVPSSANSIASNIAFGAPDASPEAVRTAARTAAIEHEIDEFAKGFDTMLGERGINLSGGQKQRTAIARALVRDPKILVLRRCPFGRGHREPEAAIIDLAARGDGATARRW